MSPLNSEEVCPLCNRELVRASDHHMIPKSRGGGPEHLLLICCDCHSAIHALFTNKELESKYNSPEVLLADPRFRRAVAFISKQDPRKKHKSKKSRNRGHNP